VRVAERYRHRQGAARNGSRNPPWRAGGDSGVLETAKRDSRATIRLVLPLRTAVCGATHLTERRERVPVFARERAELPRLRCARRPHARRRVGGSEVSAVHVRGGNSVCWSEECEDPPPTPPCREGRKHLCGSVTRKT